MFINEGITMGIHGKNSLLIKNRIKIFLKNHYYYVKKLLNEGLIEAGIVDDLETEFQTLLQNRFDEAKEIKKAKITSFL